MKITNIVSLFVTFSSTNCHAIEYLFFLSTWCHTLANSVDKMQLIETDESRIDNCKRIVVVAFKMSWGKFKKPENYHYRERVEKASKTRKTISLFQRYITCGLLRFRSLFGLPYVCRSFHLPVFQVELFSWLSFCVR